MFQSLRNLFHLSRIILVFARYHLLFKLGEHSQARLGERLSRALETLGPSFIKLGQMLSTRPDLVGAEMAADLSRLQDKLPPFPTKQAIAIIERELGGDIHQFFTNFGETAVAAASIAQVHRATTTEGTEVAVKILRPGIREALARDLKLFLWLAHLLEKRIRYFKRLKPVDIIHTFAESVKLEMDLRFEAAAASELKENCANDPGFYVPSIDWNRTSRNVLTLEWITGIPINDRAALEKAGHDLHSLAATFAVSFFNQAYRDGFFHADMHPGNLFVDKAGNIVVVDFGIMGRLDHKTRIYVAEILRGFLSRDYLHVAKVHFEAGYVPPSQSLLNFAQACRSIGEPIIGQPVNKISIARLLAQLFEITESFEMETQPQLLLLQKTMMLVEGVGAMLNPNVNMWKLAEPWIEDWVIRHMGVEARLLDYSKNALHFMNAMPKILTESNMLYNQVAQVGLKLHPETVKAITQELRKTTNTSWEIVLALLAGMALILWLLTLA